MRDASGCAAAVGRLDAVAVRFAGTQAAADAMWNEAACYKQMGNKDRAQQLWLALRSTGYRDRAQEELVAGDANLNNVGQVAGRTVAAAPAPAPPPLAAKPTAAAEASAAAHSDADPGGAGTGNARATKRASPAAAPKSQARPSPARDAYY